MMNLTDNEGTGMRSFVLSLLIALTTSPAFAGEVDVVDAQATKAADGSYRFDVTLRHADEGWEHYADAWDILAPDGTVLATRVLYHPHVDEQPFTRSLSGVEIPAGMAHVTIRGHDKVHGYGGSELTLSLR
jgi:hypothetical protein